MTEISKILYNDEVFIILKENREVIKFLKDEVKQSSLRSLAMTCQQNCEEMLKKKIDVHEIRTVTDEINYITQNFNDGTNYTAAIYLDEAYYLDSFNNMRKVYLRVDREHLHVMKEKSSGIFMCAKLAGLKFIYIYDVLPLVKNHSELCNLRLVFNCAENEVDLKLYFKKREELISVIFTIRKIYKNIVNEVRFMLNDLEYYEKYYIVMPCEETLDDYEVSLLKELTFVLDDDNMQNPKLFQLLDEILMNCKFTNVNKVHMALVEKLVQFIPSVYQSMITKSYEDATRIEIIRQEADEELKREICTKAKKISQSEGFRYFKILYSKLMNFLRLVANSKAYFKELINYDEFILILLESLSFDDTYISYQASQILASLISYKNNTAVKQEKLNKEKLLSRNLDLIGHI